MDTPEAILVLQSAALLILILLSGFFSSAETALTTVNKVRLRTFAEEGNKRAARVLKILDSYSKMLSAILVGNNIVNLSASALSTTMAMQISLPVGIATGILTLVVLIAGEIIPKTYAMLTAEKLSLRYSSVIYGLMWILTPLIFLVEKISHGLLRLFGINPNKKIESMTESELKTYVDVSHEDGVIESEEREMIYNVFDFSDALAKDVMIPRINMVTVPIKATYRQVLAVFRQSMYTRLPVYEEEKDNIIGFINIKDFILSIGHEKQENFTVRSILREAYYTHEFKKVSDLMPEIKESATTVAFVLNEYGACVGMITLEDLLEEIVGDIKDEYDADEQELIQKKDDLTYVIEGTMKLDDINDIIGTEFENEDYDSIAGIIIDNLDRLPKCDEEVVLENGIALKVLATNKNRITKVLLTLPPKVSSEEAPNEEP